MASHSLPVDRTIGAAWAERLRPSMTDLFFVAVMVWSFLASGNGWARFLLDGDVMMHTRLGQRILETGAIPAVDSASFTKPGAAWFDFEWLAEVLFAFLHQTWGFGSIALLSGTLIGLTLALVYYDCLRRGVHPFLATLLTLVATNALNLHFHARPVLFTYLFVVVTMILLNRDREQPSCMIWLLPLMAMVWVNLHPGVAILFPLIAIAGVCAGSVAGLLRYAMVGGACALATLVNPYGIELHKHLSAALSSSWILQFAVEYKSPEFRGEFMMFFAVIFLLGLGCVGMFLAQGKYTEALWILFLGYSTLVSRRHGAIFLLVVTPMAGLLLSQWWRRFVDAQPKKATARIFDEIWTNGFKVEPTFWLPLFALLIVVFNPVPLPTKPASEIYPASLVERHRELLISSRVFTSEQWADYLYYTNYPRQKVFMDPRHDFYDAEIGEPYLAIANGMPGWEKLAGRFGVNLILVKPESPLVSSLERDAGWRKLDGDQQAVLYQKL